MISVHEDVVNYNGGEFHNTDTIYAFHDWINNAGNEAFISNGIGIVYLHGNDQRIQGTDITRFYDLRLTQGGVKYGDLDVYVDGFLRLNDRRFHLDTNCVRVFNSDILSVENNGEGYVSALGTGGLLRHLENTQSYFYPVGWPNYYRPLELTMGSANSNVMKVRMAFADATNEGFDRAIRAPFLCDINPVFYHHIYQEAGNDGARIKMHYDAATDGDWNTIAHFQNVPQWEDTGDETSGIDPITGMDFHETADFITDFTYPAFALADESDTLELVASDTIICEGETVTFTAESGNLTYEFYVNGIVVQSGSDPTYTTSSIEDGDIVSFTSTIEGCEFIGSSIDMTVHPLPTASASSNSPICEQSEIQLNADGGVSYEWMGPNSFSSLEQNPTLTATLSSAGTYTVTVTNGNDCTATTSIEIIIHPAPSVTLSSNSPICDNQDLELFAEGGVSFEWSGPDGFSSNDQNPIIIQADLNANGTYIVSVTDANNCTHTASIDITIYTLPDAQSINNSPICFGEYIILSASGGTSYEWEGPDGFSSNSNNPTINNSTLANAGTYTVTVTDNNGCTNTSETEVIINDLPTPLASSNSPVCLGNALELYAEGGTTYQWAGPNGFSSNDQNPMINSVTLNNAGTYTVTVTDDNNCSNTTTTEVIIYELPSILATNNSPICEGEILNLFAEGGSSYEWVGPNTFSSLEQNPSINPVTPIHAGIYTVTGTDNNGCSNTDITSVIIHALPVAMASNNGPTCLGEDIQLNSSGGISYEWSSNNGFSSNEQNPVLENVDPSTPDIYIVTVTDSNGCTSTASTDVDVYGPVEESASNTSPVCWGEPIQFSVSGLANWNYEWSGPNGFNSSNQNPSIDASDFPDSGTYTVIVTDDNGCTGIYNTIVLVNDFPSLESQITSPICEGENVILETTFDSTWIYNWEGPFGFTDTLNPIFIENVSLENGGTYIASVSNASGCTTYDTLQLDVLEGVYAESYGDTTIFIGESAIIGILGDSSYTYNWNPTSGLNCIDCPEVLALPEASTTYGILVTNEWSCTDTFYITVNVSEITDQGLIVPNTITPNNDGYNDTWFIPWLDRFPDNQVVIINRWGDQVYASKPYNNNFDGKYESRDLPAGTYYYILILGEDFNPFKGPLTIIRE